MLLRHKRQLALHVVVVGKSASTENRKCFLSLFIFKIENLFSYTRNDFLIFTLIDAFVNRFRNPFALLEQK